MAVAKSYMDMPQLCDPFVENGKMYIKVQTKKGEKTVRWYTDKEFAKMYPEAIKVSNKKDDPYWKSQKEVLGFTKGYITIFKGDTYSHIDWFRASICRYTRWWGWYVISTEEVPEDLPEGITSVRLEWDPMSIDGETLIENEDKIREYVESVRFDPSPSKHVGEIKERLTLTLTVKRVISLENNFGHSTMHKFEDSEGNIFVWTTSAKTLQEGKTYKLRGTVKEHSMYRNCHETILTRCSNIEEV